MKSIIYLYPKLIISFFLVLFLIPILRYLTYKIIKNSQKFLNIEKSKIFLIKNIIYYGGIVLLMITILMSFGLNLTSFLEKAGIYSIGITIAAQNCLSNFISGLFLIFENTIKIGDIIEANNINGEIVSIGLLSTKIKTPQNELIRIPSDQIIKTAIKSSYYYNIKRMDIELRISTKANLEIVLKNLDKIILNDPLVLKNKKPLIIINSFTDSHIYLILGIWHKKSNFALLKNSICCRIRREMSNLNIFY